MLDPTKCRLMTWITWIWKFILSTLWWMRSTLQSPPFLSLISYPISVTPKEKLCKGSPECCWFPPPHPSRCRFVFLMFSSLLMNSVSELRVTHDTHPMCLFLHEVCILVILKHSRSRQSHVWFVHFDSLSSCMTFNTAAPLPVDHNPCFSDFAACWLAILIFLWRMQSL